MLAQGRGRGPVGVEYLGTLSGHVFIVEQQHVVGLNIQAAQGETGGAAEHTYGLARAPHNQHFVVLLAGKMQALDLRPSGWRRGSALRC
ncbi:hypothetical protein [Pseudomonas sp. R9.37]|uniref:hypothetical protein n=1 Tax=Pseudomonas sp. R9.37 TaxID=1390498 RepID=UPI0011B215BE|nr:hypothetical protein [Pseudomonas sp. R9.37]